MTDQKIRDLRSRIIQHTLASAIAEDASDYVLDAIELGKEIRELSDGDREILLGGDQ